MGNTKSRGNGEGTFYYDKTRKRWVGQKVFGIKADGKPNRISRYGKTKKECKEKLDAYELKWKNGTLIEPSKLTVHDIIKLQINDDFELNQIKATSKKRRYETLKIIDDNKLGYIPIKELNEFQIKSFLKSITYYSNSTIGKVYNAIKKCCNYAYRKKLLEANPFDNDIIKPKSDKPNKKISSLTIEEQQKLIDVLNNEEKNNKYRWQMLIMLCSGMRMGEINALTIKDIGFHFNTININKTISKDENDKPIISNQTKTDAGQRIIEMTSTLKALLTDYVNNYYRENKEGLLFYDFDKKGYIATTQVNSSYKRIIERYEIIPFTREMRPLSSKGRKKVAYKKYTYYKKVGDKYVLLPKEAPSDWNTNFGTYYYKAIIADKEYNQHMLRHTFATRCIEAEVDYKTLSEILGHTDITITLNTYCDVIGKFKQKQFNKIDLLQQSFNYHTNEECNRECNSKAF